MEQAVTIILAVVIGFVVERVWDYIYRKRHDVKITVDYVPEWDNRLKQDSDKENDSEDGKEITQ